MIASQLKARYPLLLDESNESRHALSADGYRRYRDELRQYLLRVPEE